MIARALGRFLLRTRWSSLMAVLGMTLGLTSIVAVHLVSAQVARQLDGLVPEPLARYNYTATKTDLSSADYFELRRQLRNDDVAVLPVIDESIVIAGQRVRVIGVDMLRYSLSQLGTPSAPGLLDPHSGSAPARAHTGQRSAFIDNPSVSEILSGVLVGADVGATDRPVLGELQWPGVVLADIGVAQELLGWAETDRLSYLGLNIKSPLHTTLANVEQLFPGASAGFPAVNGPTLSGFKVQSVALHNPAQSFGKSVLFNVSALGALSLVVAWFLIYQVAVFWVRRLQGVFDRLFVVGVDSRVLLAYFVGLLVLVGLLAIVAGLGLGLWLAQLLLDRSGVGELAIEIDRWVVTKAVISSLGVCILGGAWAFIRAFRTTRKQSPLLLALGFLALSALTVIGVSVPATDLFGGFLSIALLSIFLTFTITPVLRYLRGLSSRVRGSLLLRMSLREVVWFPRDLSVALAGLSLAIASAIGVGLMVDSFRTEFSAMLGQRLSYEYVVEGDPMALQALAAQLISEPQVTRSRIYLQQVVRTTQGPIEVVSTDVDAVEAERYGLSRSLAAHEVLISEQLKIRSASAHTADQVTLAEQPFEVVGVFKSFGDLVPRAVLTQPLPNVPSLVSQIRLNAQPLIADQLSNRFPDTRWQDQRLIKQAALRTFDQTFVITSILIAIAIGVGGIGIYVAVTVLRLNQRASSKLLSFMGLANREVISIDFARGAGVGLVACCFALPLGLAFGWILCAVINPRAFGWVIDLQITTSALLTPLAWGMCAAVVAGLTRVGQNEGDMHG